MKLDIHMICPDHGIIWRKDPGKIINAYVGGADRMPEKKAVIVYDTMWHSTEKMADAILPTVLTEQGVRCSTHASSEMGSQ